MSNMMRDATEADLLLAVIKGGEHAQAAQTECRRRCDLLIVPNGLRDARVRHHDAQPGGCTS